MEWIYDDGGRANAGYKGTTGDCAVRSIAIVSGKKYQEVYDSINNLSLKEHKTRRKGISNARLGVYPQTVKKYLFSLGMKWTPCMSIGSGCKYHLRAGELPSGKLLVNVSKHYTAVVDGIIHDTFDPSREGTRCVYGYYSY
jgi:hypothetical protein